MSGFFDSDDDDLSLEGKDSDELEVSRMDSYRFIVIPGHLYQTYPPFVL